MANREPETRTREFQRVTDQALNASTQAMSQALHVPAACMQENMALLQRRVQAYKDFTQAYASSRSAEDIAHTYTEFGNRMLTDYVNYYQSIGGAMMGAVSEGTWRKP